MNRQRIIEKLRTLEVEAQQYKIIRELGRGGNGVALLCQTASREQVVAKVYIPPDSRDLDERALERFENEIALTEKLDPALKCWAIIKRPLRGRKSASPGVASYRGGPFFVSL
jgi:hypothetical protein